MLGDEFVIGFGIFNHQGYFLQWFELAVKRVIGSEDNGEAGFFYCFDNGADTAAVLLARDVINLINEDYFRSEEKRLLAKSRIKEGSDAGFISAVGRI